MAEPEKIVFRLSRSVWKERSTLKKTKTENDEEKKEEAGAEGDISPTLRRRLAPNKLAVFNPSGCNQCGTTTTCNHCLRRKEQELLTMKSQYKSIKASQAPFEKNGDLQAYSTEVVSASTTSPPPVVVKNSKPSPTEKEVAIEEKPVNKRGRRRTISESVPTSEEVLKSLNTMKSSFSSRMLQNYVDVTEREVFLSAINSMTYEDILKHHMSLRVEYIQKLLRPALQSLMIHTRNNGIFNHPVDPEALGLKDYFLKITNPMDLGTIKQRLLQGYYQTLQSCVDDVTLVFRNATEYNHIKNIVHQVAIFLNNIFLEDIKSVHEKLTKESERRNAHSCDRCHGSACSFCGEKCHKWEPPIIVCHGPCGQRIKRLSIYYVSTDGAMLFCQKCYTTSGPVVSGGGGETPTSACFSPRPTTPGVTSTSSPRPAPFTPSHGSQTYLMTPGGTTGTGAGSGSQTPKPLLKKDMLKRRFDEEIYEPWVDCSTCHRRVHQVCALYNPFYEKKVSTETSLDNTTSSSAPTSSTDKPIPSSPKGLPSSSSSTSSSLASTSTSVEAPKMVTRKRGRHKRGTHLHLSDNRARAAAAAEASGRVTVAENNKNENENDADDDHPPYQCAICKLKAAINKSKRGKRGAYRASISNDDTGGGSGSGSHKKKGHHKKVKLESVPPVQSVEVAVPLPVSVSVAVSQPMAISESESATTSVASSSPVEVLTLPSSLDPTDSTLVPDVLIDHTLTETVKDEKKDENKVDMEVKVEVEEVFEVQTKTCMETNDGPESEKRHREGEGDLGNENLEVKKLKTEEGVVIETGSSSGICIGTSVDTNIDQEKQAGVLLSESDSTCTNNVSISSSSSSFSSSSSSSSSVNEGNVSESRTSLVDPMEVIVAEIKSETEIKTEIKTETEISVNEQSTEINPNDSHSPSDDTAQSTVQEADTSQDKSDKMEIVVDDDDLNNNQDTLVDVDVKEEHNETPSVHTVETEAGIREPSMIISTVHAAEQEQIKEKKEEEIKKECETVPPNHKIETPSSSSSSSSSSLSSSSPPLPLPLLPSTSAPSSLKKGSSTADSLPDIPTPETAQTSDTTNTVNTADTGSKTRSDTGPGSGWRASSLPRTKLSDFIEAMVRHRLRHGDNTTSNTPTSTDTDADAGSGSGSGSTDEHTDADTSTTHTNTKGNDSHGNADDGGTGDNTTEESRHTSHTSIGEGIMDSLTIRVVANASRSMDVPDIITDNLPTANGHRVPQYFVYRQKCILLFQEIDGIDVCLFCLYVQEFDESCPEPNKSRVYIAYLDSVEYFRPRHLRTQVYFEIIIAYLKWAQVRGFKYGHIWACPPQRGDNFIFWCHPSQQRTPSRDRLTSWYNAMLSRTKTLGICSSVQNLWTCFFEGYGKRDEGLQRQASKNSYVGKQHNTIKTSKQSKQTKKTLAKTTTATTATTSTFTAKKLVTVASEKSVPAGDEVPICPPVFEGDFWVTECTRVYRLVHTRTQGVRYDKDKALNQRKCRETLKTLMTKPIAYCFNQPVDPVALNIPDYTTVIKTPMDFGTVRDKLRSNSYRSMLEFAQDVRQTCKNALIYNPPAHVIHSLAQQLLDEFETIMIDMVTERVGEIFASSNDVDTWLATYPVNSAMEKEEKKKRAKEQQQQRALLAGGGLKGGVMASSASAGASSSGDGVTEESTATTTATLSVSASDVALTEMETETKEEASSEYFNTSATATTMEEVTCMMEVDEAEEQMLQSLLVDTTSGSASSSSSSAAASASASASGCTEEPPRSTLCDTRRVFFSSDQEEIVASDSSDQQQQKQQQQQLQQHSTVDLDSDEYDYGFVDYESGQSDSDSRTTGLILDGSASANENANENTDVDQNGDMEKSNNGVVSSSMNVSESEAGTKAPISSSFSSQTSSSSSSSSSSQRYKTLSSISGQDSVQLLRSRPPIDRDRDRDRDDSKDSLLELGRGSGMNSMNSMGSMSSAGSGGSGGIGVGERGILRQDSMESVQSVAEQWPRRPDRTSSMCVEESSSMEASSFLISGSGSGGSGSGGDDSASVPLLSQTQTITQAEILTSPPPLPRGGERLSIDIAATQAVSVKFGMNSVGRKNALNTNLPFDKPQLGVKGAQALMSELSRNVCRLKDDMYVLIFTSPTTFAAATSDLQQCHDQSTSTSNSNSNRTSDSGNSISPECMRMLQGIVPDTSDPDPVIRSPFIESRQTFLEMCQFRHLQFDCLRRAKYSSSLLIFHLLFPTIKSTRPHCKICKRQIKNVRWHCEVCQIEVCNACKYSKSRTPHEHEESLTPVRVSFR